MNCSPFFSDDDFINGEWRGTFSCPYDNENVSFALNTHQLASSIGISADLDIRIHSIPVTGTYASYVKFIQFHSDYFDAKEISGPVQTLGFVQVDMSGQLVNNEMIVGNIVFESYTCSDIVCPMVLTRVKGMYRAYPYSKCSKILNTFLSAKKA